MQFLNKKKEISFRDVFQNHCSFSPSNYKSVNMQNNNTKEIRDLLEEEVIPGTEVGSLAYTTIESNYKFLRTKACQRNNFHLDLSIPDSFEYIKPNEFFFRKGKNDRKTVEKGDLLFVTGGNVGEVAIAQDIGNTIISSHFFKLPISKNKLYVFSILKSDFGKVQSNFGPIGSIGGLDTFTKDTLLSIKIPFPTQQNGNEVIEYVEMLVRAVLRREEEIKKRIYLIWELIENELSTNQHGKEFVYEHPSFSEIKKRSSRLETGMYTEEFKRLDHILNNYTGGWRTLSDLNYSILRGQNLQFTAIGKSLYSKIPKNRFYKLALSKNFTEYGTMKKYHFVGNKNKLKEIEKGDVILSCRGVLFGRICIFCEDVSKTITNIDNVHIKNEGSSLHHKIFIGLFLSYLRNKGHLHRIAITGSGANSLTKYQFNLLKFPNFPENIYTNIAMFFYKNPDIQRSSLTLNDFEEKDNLILKQSGIYQLDKQIKKIRKRIENVIKMIAENRLVEIKFDLL